MMISLALVSLLLLSDAPRWELAAEPEGVKVYRRQVEGSEVREMRAIGLINATPKEVFDVIQDLENYPKQMPYTAEAKVLSRSADGKDTLFYSRLNTPMVDERDYSSPSKTSLTGRTARASTRCPGSPRPRSRTA